MAILISLVGSVLSGCSKTPNVYYHNVKVDQLALIAHITSFAREQPEAFRRMVMLNIENVEEHSFISTVTNATEQLLGHPLHEQLQPVSSRDPWGMAYRLRIKYQGLKVSATNSEEEYEALIWSCGKNRRDNNARKDDIPRGPWSISIDVQK